ncbi:AlkZ family DNA glycosylase [Plantactinospora sp. S1510]|uniref:AlkZ family DNA glycosylase n=1 Tax=Plantactinospora alkalitolerans TaxID=2789879 RepID=A0ABS0HBD8_9ACTN|nr:winged helix DNA-binding domain-containing protein [Plantactinospora alkalitolerans]MBF9135444.1 AlkZ family DNA glycosylase [Plantactinospora alkalitolerans]
MTRAVLHRRALNRATLHRQLLLDRSDLSAIEAIEHLVGLQAQTPQTWYVGLWTRLRKCRGETVGELLTSRQAVRIALMRSTIHLVSAADALALRPLLQPLIERGMGSNHGKLLIGLARDEVVAAGRELLDERPLSFDELGRSLAQRWPDRDPAALAQGIRAWVPLVQVPPRGVWGRTGIAAHATLDDWLGAEPRRDYPIEEMLSRYLAAYGPATVRDMQVWSGLTRLAEVVERMGSRLVGYRDENGAELFDLPDAARPDPDTPAPPRFLYDYDNLLLSYDDRTRVVTDGYRRRNTSRNGMLPRAILLDGYTAGTWKTTVARGTATLTIEPFARLSKGDAEALAVEGESLLRFLTGGKPALDVRFVEPVSG